MISKTLEDYLKKNAIGKEQKGDHANLITTVSKDITQLENYNPKEIQLFREVVFRKERLVKGAVDLIALSSEKIILFEMKVIYSLSQNKILYVRKDIEKQLTKAHNFFQENFGINPILIGVYRYTHETDYHHYTMYMKRKQYLEDMAIAV